jgi:hypothetical protein
MAAPRFDPAQEKALLSGAIGALERAWGKPGMAQALTALRTALAHAEHALAILEREPERDTAFAVHVAGLGIQVTYARAELELAEESTYRRRDGKSAALDIVLPAGTVVACPRCGEGLYKTTTRLTTADLVQDDGTLLTPLNPSIPQRYSWAPLDCPLCYAWLLQDGRICTLQEYGE